MQQFAEPLFPKSMLRVVPEPDHLEELLSIEPTKADAKRNPESRRQPSLGLFVGISFP